MLSKPKRRAVTAVLLAYAGGYGLHRLHADLHEAHQINPTLHWLRDSSLAFPPTLLVVLVATAVAGTLVEGLGLTGRRNWERVVWALVAAVGYAIASIPGNIAHGWLFGAGHEGQGALGHAVNDASAALGAALVILVGVTVLLGAPCEPQAPVARALGALRRRGVRGTAVHALDAVAVGRGARAATALVPAVILVACAAALTSHTGSAGAATGGTCEGFTFTGGTRTIEADVVALEQRFYYNRLGVLAGAPEDPYGLVYALRGDVVDKTTGLTEAEGGTLTAGNVELRPGKRPRPLVLRMNVGDCLVVHFQNLLAAAPKPDHPADRHVSIHVNGLQMANAGGLSGIASDGSFVGENESSLAAPGEKRDYALFAEYENTYLMYSMGTPVGGEGLNASISLGLFGAINVEPWGTEWYRSLVTREEMDIATT